MLALLQELGRHEVHFTGAHVVVALVAAGVTAICVQFHYKVMSFVSLTLPRLRKKRRPRIVIVMLTMLAAHIAEIWFFGMTYCILDRYPTLGALDGPLQEGLSDFVYFSASTYTTLGYGDFTPSGAMRVLSGTEALVGIGMITWTASLLFLEMQRDWAEFRRPKE